MPDRHSLRTPPRSRPRDPLVAAARLYEHEQTRTRGRDLHSYASWQQEAWSFFESLGEAAWAVEWLTAALSRVRLVAAEVVTGGDEPVVIEEGFAADVVAQLGADTGGHGGLLSAFVPQLSVPGEGWLVVEQQHGVTTAAVRSTDEIRQSSQLAAAWDVREDTDRWRPLPPEALVTRVWQPSPRLHYEATSAYKAALPIMRRIDLIDRRIVSTMVSRLAMNGLLLIPAEGTFSTPKQYKDAADPFVQWLIDVASNNIKNPGSASAAIPMPVKFSKDMIEQWRHLTFGDVLPTELLEERDKELRRLATSLNVPAEVILGLTEVNHWTAWQIDEAAIKMHVAPLAQVIVDCLTTGFLRPLLAEGGQPLTGPNGGLLVVWYDTSELTARPDKTDAAFRAYDRLEISGNALLRETGLDEADKPTDAELVDQVLKRLATTVQLGPWSIEQLGGTVAPPPQTPAGPAGGPDAGPPAAPAAGPAGNPDTRRRIGPPSGGEAPAPPDADMPASALLPAWLRATVPLPPDWDRQDPGRSPPQPVGANGNGRNGHRPKPRRGRR